MMLSEQQIQQALHAHRVVPLGVANPHGPLGLEQLAAAVSQVIRHQPGMAEEGRPIVLPVATWRKLEELARSASHTQPQTLTASDVAAAILERAVNGQ
jgi:hypothetical protein